MYHFVNSYTKINFVVTIYKNNIYHLICYLTLTL
jgi:hypothetical protein